MSLITSIHNRRVKQAVKLRQSRQRRKQGRIIIDGIRELARAIAAGETLIEVFVCPSRCQSNAGQQLVDQISCRGIEILQVTPAILEKLAFGNRNEGIVAVAQTPLSTTLEQLQLPPQSLLVVLEGIEKPGNIGAIIRSADGAGAAAVVVSNGGTDLYNPNTIRSSLGTIFTMPVVAATSQEAYAWLHKRGVRILAARLDGVMDYADADYSGAVAIVVGSEAEGLSPLWRRPTVTAIRLPMHGRADSLNVSAAAAILLYEAQRQRKYEVRRMKDEG